MINDSLEVTTYISKWWRGSTPPRWEILHSKMWYATHQQNNLQPTSDMKMTSTTHASCAPVSMGTSGWWQHCLTTFYMKMYDYVLSGLQQLVYRHAWQASNCPVDSMKDIHWMATTKSRPNSMWLLVVGIYQSPSVHLTSTNQSEELFYKEPPRHSITFTNLWSEELCMAWKQEHGFADSVVA